MDKKEDMKKRIVIIGRDNETGRVMAKSGRDTFDVGGLIEEFADVYHIIGYTDDEMTLVIDGDDYARDEDAADEAVRTMISDFYNFYNCPPTIGEVYEELHNKSNSAGWMFALRKAVNKYM